MKGLWRTLYYLTTVSSCRGSKKTERPTHPGETRTLPRAAPDMATGVADL